MWSLADFVSSIGSDGLLFAWTLAMVFLCLLGWLAFTIRQRQYRDDAEE